MARATQEMLSADGAERSRRWRPRLAVCGGHGGVIALLAVAASLVAFVDGARADGDPASDYLVSRQVFVSSQENVESPAQRELLATVGAANRAGFAIRVAIISSDYDLGSIAALWRKPTVYARFLGLELASAYRGRLLVVMPDGFGFSWPGHPTGDEYRLVARATIGAGRAGLLRAAQSAVRRLAAADGIALSAAAAARPERARGDRGAPVMTVAVAVAVLAVLVGCVIVVVRWRSGRMTGAHERAPGPAGTTRRLRLRVALPGFVALGAVAVGAPIMVVRSARQGAGNSAAQAGSIVTPPPVTWPADRRLAPDFVLRDQDGHSVSVVAYRGRPVIVTFIDPLCRNLCPLEAKVLNDVAGRMPARARPAIVAVSVDVYGGANRRGNLMQDVHKWQLVPQWHWAVGTPAQLAAVWRRYDIGVKVTTNRIDETTIHYITHTEAAFILDATGHERALFLWPFHPQDVGRILRQLW
jgi:cytochrome oxidase Cu insertion factor (SCO1/SenC/PrrC family)